jgi:hypothetical protein
VTEPHDWPPEQSAHGSLRPWHATAAGYLAVLFEDPAEAQRAQHGLQQHGVSPGDLRLYDGEETLRIASRLQQERSILARAINEVVVDRTLRERWLANARAAGRCCGSMPRPRTGPPGWWGCSPTTVMGRCATSARTRGRHRRDRPLTCQRAVTLPADERRGRQGQGTYSLTCGAMAAAGAVSQATAATA